MVKKEENNFRSIKIIILNNVFYYNIFCTALYSQNLHIIDTAQGLSLNLHIINSAHALRRV